MGTTVQLSDWRDRRREMPWPESRTPDATDVAQVRGAITGLRKIDVEIVAETIRVLRLIGDRHILDQFNRRA